MIVYTADVFCDWENDAGDLCGEWTDGVVLGNRPPGKRMTRREAAKIDGAEWRLGVRLPDGRIGDICPQHRAPFARDGAPG